MKKISFSLFIPLLFLVFESFFGQPPSAREPVALEPPRVLTYSTRDVIDERIDVAAQRSLVRMSNNPSTSSYAVTMVYYVKNGLLAGIYQENQLKPAQRAVQLGKTGWSQLIPTGLDATIVLDPANLEDGPPLIAFRRNMENDHARIDAALLDAWREYMDLCNGKAIIQSCTSRPPEDIPELIKWIQASLNQALGIRLPMTGVCGDIEKSAIKSFQQKEGLSATGNIDAPTQQALMAFSNVAPYCKIKSIFQDAENDVRLNNWLPFPDYRFSMLKFGTGPIRKISSPILSDGKSGADRLSAVFLMNVIPYGPYGIPQSPKGQLFFAKTLPSKLRPQLWLVFVPKDLNLHDSFPIHIFFSPKPTPAMLRSPYPYGPEWKGFAIRYLVNKRKKLLHQHDASGKRCILVFPIPQPVTAFGKLTDGKILRTYLLELVCWLQQHPKLGLKDHKIKPKLGRCAASGFSYAGRVITELMRSTLQGGFPELDEFYFFDTAALPSSNEIRQWLNGGHIIRIYKSPHTRTVLPNFLRQPIRKNSGANEWAMQNGTFLFTPKEFWGKVFAESRKKKDSSGTFKIFLENYDYPDSHQLIPCVFLQHALANSGFPISNTVKLQKRLPLVDKMRVRPR